MHHPNSTAADRAWPGTAAVPADVAQAVFGREFSRGKGQGLSGMLELSVRAARQRLAARTPQ